MTKTAVITGAGKGLGFAFCKQFLSEGYTVCALDKLPTDELYALESKNPNVKVFKVDITNGEEITKCREEVEKYTAVLIYLSITPLYGLTKSDAM